MNTAFTDQTKAVMQYAREESMRLRHDYIGTEHLLLGIIKDSQGEAAKALTRLGVNLDTLRQSIDDFVSSSTGSAKPGEEPPFTPRTKHIVDLATAEARALQTQHVGVEHLLLALLKDREGVASQILAAFGVDYRAIQAEVKEPGSAAKPEKPRIEQKAFILYYWPIMDAEKNVIEKTNLDDLNKLLSEGWMISGKEQMSGQGAGGYNVSLLLLSRRS